MTRRDGTQLVASGQQESARYVAIASSVDTFGGRLRKAFSGSTNREIADKLGVSKSAVTNYIQGRIPSPETLAAIAELTGCSLHWLITGNGSQFVNAEAKWFADDFQLEQAELATRLRKTFPSLTVEQIADRLNLPASAVEDYFNGRLPATEILVRIADLTGVSLTWLLTNKGPQWAQGTVQPGGENQNLSSNGSLPPMEAVRQSPENQPRSDESLLLAHIELVIKQQNLTIEQNKRTIKQNNRIIQLLEKLVQQGS